MAQRPDSLILVYDGQSGLRAMLLDVVKKAAGREECPLCEITYSAVGKRRSWVACERRLGISVKELHRDQLPSDWNLAAGQLPCVLARVGNSVPTILVTREEIIACRKSADELENKIRAALAARQAPDLAPVPA